LVDGSEVHPVVKPGQINVNAKARRIFDQYIVCNFIDSPVGGGAICRASQLKGGELFAGQSLRFFGGQQIDCSWLNGRKADRGFPVVFGSGAHHLGAGTRRIKIVNADG